MRDISSSQQDLDFQILYQDEFLLVVDKPPNCFVHPPEIKGVRVEREFVLMYQIKKKLNLEVYPIHRLDFATSGCVVFALSSRLASLLGRSLMEGGWTKKYHAVLRGWLQDHFEWDRLLKSQKDPNKMLRALSLGRLLSKIELPPLPNSKFQHSRYSLVEIELKTGRYHQIRRHANQYSHPVIGDVAHGDRHHNRYFREQLAIPGLLLRAKALEFWHPEKKERLKIDAPENPSWIKIYALFSTAT